MSDPDLEDALSDLAHDLGKGIHRPLAWLPAEADAGAVRAAVEEALFATRRRGDERTSAATLWGAFLAEVGPRTGAAWAAMVAAVDRALAWGAWTGPLDRAQVQADFAAVTPAIRAVLEEIERG